VVLQMENGDKIYETVEGQLQTSGAKAAYSTVTTLRGGTGKFASIRGLIRGGGVTDFKTARPIPARASTGSKSRCNVVAVTSPGSASCSTASRASRPSPFSSDCGVARVGPIARARQIAKG
jgi:hypothetical protein